MASSFSSSIRHRRPPLVEHEVPPEGKGNEEEETRDWAELPLDALLAVLGRFDVVDILVGAGHVCRPWRRAAREEPELWRNIHIRRHAKLAAADQIEAAMGAAVRRSAGRCEAFRADDVAGDQYSFFLFLAEAAPQLKSLRLFFTSCYKISKRGLNVAIKKLPMLEELELSLNTSSATGSGFCSFAETCAAAAGACPLLKRLRLNKHQFHWGSDFGDSEAMEIAKMRGLQSLQLFGNSLGNAGLTAILDGCVSLESLDIRHCFNVEMDGEMGARRARLQTLRLPDDSMDDYEVSFGSPVMDPGSPEEERQYWSPGDPDNIFSSWYFR
ncbi:unnamed protein product [Urochloa decumbens]|uniref:F-box domain-containing protein n=1 Tax=Urochloa decumbens TaxID=240449 RepID=A0ABC9BDI4_9POAL